VFNLHDYFPPSEVFLKGVIKIFYLILFIETKPMLSFFSIKINMYFLQFLKKLTNLSLDIKNFISPRDPKKLDKKNLS